MYPRRKRVSWAAVTVYHAEGTRTALSSIETLRKENPAPLKTALIGAPAVVQWDRLCLGNTGTQI